MDPDEPGYWIGSYTVNLFVTEEFFLRRSLEGCS
jgi:hypothetical protein